MKIGSQRGMAALVIAPLLVVALAACAGAEPEAVPMPTPTPTPTVEAPPEAKPGSRVPLSCDELAAVPSEFSDVAVTAVDTSMDLVLAGFTNCELAASVASTPVRLMLLVVPEVDDPGLAPVPSWEPLVLGFAGPMSGAACGAYGDLSSCQSVAVAKQYTIAVYLGSDSGAVPVEPTLAALASFTIGLVSALDAAGEPLPAWDPGPGLLRYPPECETEMREVDQPIIDALPFESGPAEYRGSGDGPEIYLEAERRAGSSLCTWSGNVSSGSFASVTIWVLPGASFAIDDGRFAPEGTEIVVSGADPAWQGLTSYGTPVVTVVVDRSIVIVNYDLDYRSIDPDPEASLLAVVAAVIATGPRV